MTASHKHRILEEDVRRNCIKVYAGYGTSSLIFGSLRMVGVTGPSLAYHRILRHTDNKNEFSPYVYRVRCMDFDRKYLYIQNHRTKFEVEKLWEERHMSLKRSTKKGW